MDKDFKEICDEEDEEEFDDDIDSLSLDDEEL